MPFELLSLTFSGLTALVPRTEGDPNQATEWLVVMPALRGGANPQIRGAVLSHRAAPGHVDGQ